MFYNPYSSIISSHVKEKIYQGSNFIYEISPKHYPFFLNIDKIEVNYTFNNYSANRAIFYTFLLLMEKLTLVRHKFITMKKTIASFNIKEGLISGALYQMYSFKKNRFLHMFINYSLKKLNSNIVLSTENIRKKNVSNSKSPLNNILFTSKIDFGLRKFLFHGIISSSDIEYEFFLPLFQNNISGMHFSFHFYLSHFLVNRLILSHNNITIY